MVPSLISLMTFQRSSFCEGPASALWMLRTRCICVLALPYPPGAHSLAMLYLYIPLYTPGFGFPASWQWKYLPEMLPIGELAATPKSGFWQKGILWGVLLPWNYNFMPLRLHSIILKFRVFVETDPDGVGMAGHSLPSIFFKDNFQSFFYLSIYLTPFYYMSPTHQMAWPRLHGYNRLKSL